MLLASLAWAAPVAAFAHDELVESPEVREIQAGLPGDLFTIPGLPQHSYSLDVKYDQGTLVPLRALGTVGFVIKPTGTVDPERRWIWVSNLFLAVNWSDGGGVVHRFTVEQALERGFHVAGIDVGTSLGSPAGAKLYHDFHQLLVEKYQLHPRARMLGHSNGGLITLGFAFRHPDLVERILGIFPATDLRSWPGLERAAGAGRITPEALSYELDQESLTERLAEFNPIDNLKPLAEAHVEFYHIHGTLDDVVPLGPNTEEFARRYKQLGGKIEVEVIAGGKHGGEEFYHSQAAVDFLLH